MTDKIPYLDLPAQIRGLRKELDAAIARTSTTVLVLSRAGCRPV